MSFLNTIVCGDRAEDLLNRGLLRPDMFTAIAYEQRIASTDGARSTWRKLGRLHMLLGEKSPAQFVLDDKSPQYLLIADSLGNVASWCSSPANSALLLPKASLLKDDDLDVCRDMAFVLGVDRAEPIETSS